MRLIAYVSTATPHAIAVSALRWAMLLLVGSVSLCAQGIQIDNTFTATIGHRVIARSGFTLLQPDGRILAGNASVRYNADGSRDPSYRAPAYPGSARDIILTPDNKILVWSSDLGPTSLVQFNSDGTLDKLLALTDSLSAIAVQPNGKILVVPIPNFVNFTIDGVRRNGIARLNANGTLDTTFDPGTGPSGGVRCIAVQPDGKVVLGGEFSSFNGIPRAWLVRLNLDGSVDMSFRPASLDLVPSYLFVAPDGRVYVALNSGNTAIPARLLRLKTDGSLDANVGNAGGADANNFNAIEALAVQPDGRLLIGGSFTDFNGRPTTNLARLNLDGSVDAGFSPAGILPGEIVKLAVQPDGRILFREVSGGSAMFRLRVDGGLDAVATGTTPRFSLTPPGFMTGATQPDGRIVLVGDFDSVNGVPRPGIARLLPNWTLDGAFVPVDGLQFNFTGADPPSWHVAVQPDGAVTVVGPFTQVGASSRRGFARFLANGALDRIPGQLLFDERASLLPVSAVGVLSDGRVVMGGAFSSVNVVPHGNLMALRADGSPDPAFAAAAFADGRVRFIVPRAGGGLLVAGDFLAMGGAPRSHIAALTPGGLVDPGFSTGVPMDDITALAATPDGGAIIATSRRSSPNGFPRARLVRLTSRGEIDPSFAFGLEVNATFTVLLPDAEGRVVAAFAATERWGGLGDSAKTTYYLARFNRAGGVDSTFNAGTGPSGPISALFAGEGTLTVLGEFSRFDDLPLALAGILRLRTNASVNSGDGLLINVSTRGQIGDYALVAGFVIGGSVPKTVLIRAVGPTLRDFGFADALLTPSIRVHQSDEIASNSGWYRIDPGRAQADHGFNVSFTGNRLGAWPFSSPNDAAVVLTLAPGAYTADVIALTRAGTTLMEVFDANTLAGDRRLLNISTRGFVGTGDNVLIAGFIVSGSRPKQFLIRAAGPGLASFGVAGTLADPRLAVADSRQAIIATNDDWNLAANKAALSAAATKVGAFPFADPSKDSGLLLTLDPGLYTAIVGGNNGTGVSLVEVYEVP